MKDFAKIFPGIPVVEAPIFETIVGSLHLSEEELRIATSLNRDGYAILDFDDALLEDRIDRIRRNLGPAFGMAEAGDNGAEVTVGRIQDAWHTDADVRAIAANQPIVDLLTKLWGRRAFPFQTLNFPVGTEQHLHADTAHFSSIPERFMCGVWLAMEDVSPEAGPLQYVPGSHRWPIVDNTMIGRWGSDAAIESAQVPYHEAWQALLMESGQNPDSFLPKKGQALIWCANLLHGGRPRLDPALTRWSQVTHYYFEDCIYYTPAFSNEPIGRLDLRTIVSAANGRPRPNIYLGQMVKSAADAASRPTPFWRRVSKHLRRRRGRKPAHQNRFG